MATTKLLAFAGSARRESWNRRLVHIAARQARELGADVTELNLAELNLPLFDEDLESEQGEPAGAQRLKRLMFEADGFLIACPEYNSSITPLLKNAIDWASRPAEGESRLQAYQGKVAGLISASPGALGGLRGLVHVRAILGNIGVVVIPDQVAVSSAHEAFTAYGSAFVANSPFQPMLDKVVKRLVEVAGRLR